MDGEYRFQYTDAYLADPELPSIALAFPRAVQAYHSRHLFPFFFGLLSEGANMKLQCQILKIDEEDYFTRLLKTANSETIGAITVHEVE